MPREFGELSRAEFTCFGRLALCTHYQPGSPPKRIRANPGHFRRIIGRWHWRFNGKGGK